MHTDAGWVVTRLNNTLSSIRLGPLEATLFGRPSFHDRRQQVPSQVGR